MQIKETCSTAKSEYSESSFSKFSNSEQFVNFQQTISNLNHETPNSHYKEFDQSYAHSLCKDRSTDMNSVYNQNHNSFAESKASQILSSNICEQFSQTHSERITCDQCFVSNNDLNSSRARVKHIQNNQYDINQFPSERLQNTMMPCNGKDCHSNIHIHYNITYTVPTAADIPAPIHQNNESDSESYNYGDALVCDV